MTTYQSRLSGREEVAEDTMAFHLEKPAGFQFKAGQYVDISLILKFRLHLVGVIQEHAAFLQKADMVQITMLIEGNEKVGLVASGKDLTGANPDLKN